MKKMLHALLILSVLSPLSVLAEEIRVTVKGMVCSFCAQGIKKSLSKNENVKATSVDLDHKVVTIETKEGRTLHDEEIKKIISDAGYDVMTIERSQHA